MAETDAEPVTRDGQNVLVVHDSLREAILNGEMVAGTTASQVAISQELDVGRTTVREALRMLQREGLIVGEPNRRPRIAPLSGTDAEELYIMRITLEAVAIRLTVPLLTSKDIAELEGCMAQMEHFMRHKDWRGLRDPHRAFHAKLVQAAGPRVTTTIEQLFDHAERYRHAYGASSDQEWMVRAIEHRAIVDAAQQGDTELAARKLAGHYAQTAKQIFAGLQPDHDLSHLRTAIHTVAPGAEAVLDQR
jgi:DNA-binding GntR family transcriptional regulator